RCETTPRTRLRRCGVTAVSFFFQAEAGIRDFHVTGVQTCALPILFLQPLLPTQYQVAPVCETITRALLIATDVHTQHSASEHHHFKVQSGHIQHDHHDDNHQCQYCTVYAILVLPSYRDIKHVLDRVQVLIIC